MPKLTVEQQKKLGRETAIRFIDMLKALEEELPFADNSVMWEGIRTGLLIHLVGWSPTVPSSDE